MPLSNLLLMALCAHYMCATTKAAAASSSATNSIASSPMVIPPQLTHGPHGYPLRRSSTCPQTWDATDGPVIEVNSVSGSDAQCSAFLKIPCRTVEHAVGIMMPGGTVRILEGIYPCSPSGIYITKALRIYGVGTVVFMCKGQGRAFWFDNVYAFVENVKVLDGNAPHSGGILVTMDSDYDVRCSHHFIALRFHNCSGWGSASDVPTTAGGLNIVYRRGCTRKSVLLDNAMDRNYARGSTVVAGAIAMVYTPSSPPLLPVTEQSVAEEPSEESTTTQTPACRWIEVSGLPHPIDAFNGPYSIPESADNNTYIQIVTPWMARPVAAQLYFCTSLGKWVFTYRSVNPHKTDCRAQIIGGELHPLNTSQWTYRTQSGTWTTTASAVTLTCDDEYHSLPHLYLSGIPEGQASRSGLYSKMTETYFGRPMYRFSRRILPVEGSKLITDYLFYCAQTNEWIVTDEVPNATSTTCQRGLASPSTMASHPMRTDMREWKYWQTPHWHNDPNPPLVLKYNDPREGCNTVQMFFRPEILAADGIYHRIPNATWNDLPIFQKPHAGPYYIWYCKLVEEWGMSPIDPLSGFKTEQENCMRSVSSHPNREPDPTLWLGNWNYWNSTAWEWSYQRLNVLCVDGCAHISVDGVLPKSREYQGVYHKILFQHEGTNVYRKESPDSAHLWYKGNRWVITEESPEDEVDSEPIIESDPASGFSPLSTDRYNLNNQSVPEVNKTGVKTRLFVTCAYSASCDRVNIENLPKAIANLSGVYTFKNLTKNLRRVFVKDYFGGLPDSVPGETPVLFYCAAQRKWSVGPFSNIGMYNSEPCSSWLASLETAATHPIEIIQWDSYVRNRFWYAVNQPLKVTCFIEQKKSKVKPPVPKMRSVTVPHVIIRGCMFTDNQAKSTGMAGGAMTIYQQRPSMGSNEPTSATDLSLSRNEAVVMERVDVGQVCGSGLVVVGSAQPLLLTRASFHGNNAEVGPLAVEGGVKLECTHCAFLKNRASTTGGAARLGRGVSAIFNNLTCFDNSAQSGGGCMYGMDHGTHISIKDSYLSGGIHSAGPVTITHSRLVVSGHLAIRSPYLTLSPDCDILCAGEKQFIQGEGFSCHPDGSELPPYDARPPKAATAPTAQQPTGAAVVRAALERSNRPDLAAQIQIGPNEKSTTTSSNLDYAEVVAGIMVIASVCALIFRYIQSRNAAPKKRRAPGSVKNN